MPPQLQLVQHELHFYFIGRQDRRILFSIQAISLDEAQQKFLAAGHSVSEALLIIQTETQIFLA